jgi:hypothetical protein
MRTAAIVSASIVVIGMYLAVAAILSLAPTATALGVLAVSLVTAIALVAADASGGVRPTHGLRLDDRA